jgi:hypothetical protein
MTDTTSDATPQSEKPKSETGYLLVVCVLLVVISASLAWLWQVQKSHTDAANRRADAAQQALLQQRQSNPLAELLSKAAQQEQPSRQDIPAQTIQFEGRPTPLYKISATAGMRIGFEPGDLILVGNQPASGLALPATTEPAAPPAR